MALPTQHNWLRRRSDKEMMMSVPVLNSASNHLRMVFVTNLCPHYRIKTFETLARYHNPDFYFFSSGDEWYLWRGHGKRAGNFNYEYLPGINFAGMRLTPTLLVKLWRGNYDVFLKCIAGRFALPITYVVARLRRKPFILWTGLWATLQSTFHRLFFPLTRYVYRHADAIVVYGEHVKRYLIEQGVRAERIFVAAHAVDNAVYSRPVPEAVIKDLREKLNISPTDLVLLYAGRMEESKGLTYLVRAFYELEHKDAILLFLGEGGQTAALQRQVSELGLTSRVRFAGYVPPEDTLPYYALAYVSLLPSVSTPQGKEQWGLVVNEAMNQGVPVIATEVVGAAAGGLVQDGINGFVVPERDSSALADALRKIMENSAIRNEMSTHARRIIAAWDNENMVLGFRRAIDFVTAKRESQKPLSVQAQSAPEVGLRAADSRKGSEEVSLQR
jgi:glycosyltransferase involved in cell wall biosynthesis